MRGSRKSLGYEQPKGANNGRIIAATGTKQPASSAVTKLSKGNPGGLKGAG